MDLSINIFAKETKETKELNAKLREKKFHRDNVREKQGAVSEQKRLVKQIGSLLSFLFDPSYPSRQVNTKGKKTFTWENLNYHVPGPNGPIRLLHDVCGYVKPGTLTALMGASGAGNKDAS